MKRWLRGGCIACCLVASSWLPASPWARAEGDDAAPPSAEVGTDASADDHAISVARDAFVLGTSLARSGEWRDALAAFERSAALRPHPVTIYNLGFCERALGRYTRSREHFIAALDAHERRADGVLTEELLLSAQAYLLEADERIARIGITLEPPDAAVSVDGRPLGIPARAATQPPAQPVLAAGIRPPAGPAPPKASRFVLLVDPGPHVFIVARAGVPAAVVERSFAAGASGELTLRALVPPSRSAGKPLVGPVAEEAGEAPFSDTPGYVALGVGAASLTLGGVLGIAFLVNRDDLEGVCKGAECPSDRQDQIDRTNRIGSATWIALGVGAAGLGAGVVLLAVGGPSTPPPHARAPRLELDLAFGTATLRGSF